MAPRNRHGTGTSPSPSATPSSTPPTAVGLTKRQRQALRINRPPLSAASSPAPASPPDLPSAGTSPASFPVEGIRIRQPVDEEERASPSKYPTPLPDEEEDDLPVRALVEKVEEDEQEQPVFDVADIDEGGREVPTGVLIDVEKDVEEEAEPLVPIPNVAEVEPREPARRIEFESQFQAQARPKEMAPVPTPQSEPARPSHTEGDTVRKAPAPNPARRRRSPPSPPFVASAPTPPTRDLDHGYGAQIAHLRAPEAPRHPPPRALSALSHTLRALAAAGTQAVTAYANGVGSGGELAHLQPRRDVRRDGEDGDGEERILGARWDEVEVDVLEG